jgi:hypothetical protein
MTQTRDLGVVDRLLCAQCGTELVASALACPACRAIIHADRLKELAATATDLNTRGKLVEARDTWLEALELLPTSAQQHAAIGARVADLTRRIEASTDAASKPKAHGPWWKRGFVAAATLLVLLLGKLKFRARLHESRHPFSMLLSLGVYWQAFGWKWAVGVVTSIYIHEMGHVAMLRRLGIKAPLFIRESAHCDTQAAHRRSGHRRQIGLAGPIWGLGAGLAAYAILQRRSCVARDRPAHGLDQPFHPDSDLRPMVHGFPCAVSGAALARRDAGLFRDAS